MNIFYAPSAQIDGEYIELRGQEARHASRVLRYREGDAIVVCDGKGGWYEGEIRQVLEKTVQVRIREQKQKEAPVPRLVLGMAIIKKRDRLEFAVEKAVELGAMEIALFRSTRTVKENVRPDRLEAVALAGMKQSMRAHLPKIRVFDSLDSLLERYSDHQVLVAHEKVNQDESRKDVIPDSGRKAEKLLLLVGPEGGFSEEEIQKILRGPVSAETVSLGAYRLRTETAVAAFLSQFIQG